ncbi:transcription coactivator isoform X2 [Tasmannia lanceolata]|uniref:transcription coactivator isoform X2 n=1 Tax=Tasmannia lanceolata TaxID=3420 RepID=UPI004064885A
MKGGRMLAPIFKGANVFLSRNLVEPEMFDALHDALKLNGAQIFLCCDPSRSTPNDYHVISSFDHEKFEHLRAKGCNLLGPQCILSCANEHRDLPKQGYTCCLAMDGVKVLASGFEKDEKVEIEKRVTAMGGVSHTKASLDVNFVIVKNVLAAKYKWATNVLKKPIVTIDWLYQCWKEHRVAPQEPYRILPFTGLTICVTRIPADERKEMERLIIQNGGHYSPDLTKKCTHLVSDAPEGDKYQVARRWGHINIVMPRWVDQSVARRACLNEELYPVRGASVSSSNAVKVGLKGQHIQDKGVKTSECVPSPVTADLETTLSQNTGSAFSDATFFTTKETDLEPSLQVRDEAKFQGCVAEDSQSEDNDLYLSDCRILFVGFEATELRKLVNMVRKGGGTRHMSFSEKLTHIIVGTLSEKERKEVRHHATWGVINVVTTFWLEDCDREKKEIPVSERHIASDLLFPKANSITGVKQGKSSGAPSGMPADQVLIDATFDGLLSEKNSGKARSKTNLKASGFLEQSTKSSQQIQASALNDEYKAKYKIQDGSCIVNGQDARSSNIFKGRLFRFSSSFPEDRRAEIVEWVIQGGGMVIDDQEQQNVHFIIELHGQISRHANVSQSTIVSSHWIRSCLEEGCMPDVGSHILYSPLPCQIPLPGFEGLRFCISQYEEKDRLLLRNLCFVLGAKFTEKLSRKVSHLLCKFTSGPKYEAACKWGIESVTAEWITQCIRKDKMVALDPFRPKPVTAQDRESGLCTQSQYPTQAAHIVSGDISSHLQSDSHGPVNMPTQTTGARSNSFSDEAKYSIASIKRAKNSELGRHRDSFSAEISAHQDVISCQMNSTKNSISEDCGEGSHAVPDVADAIEDLLAQSNKIQDMKSPGRNGCDRSIFSPDRSILGQDHTDSRPAFGISKHWLNRTEKQDNLSNPSGHDRNQSTYDGFSETQTESQVVGYEEDLSGRQMIIERVRTRSMS